MTATPPPMKQLFCKEGHVVYTTGCAACSDTSIKELARCAAEYVETPAKVEELITGSTTKTCSECGHEFVGFLASLCDDCTDRARSALIPSAITAKTFAKTFPERAIRDTATMTGPALDKARQILPLLRKPGQGAIIILLGDRWTGKTVMATWWAGMLGTGLYTKAFDIFASLRRTFRDDSKVKEHEVLARYRDAAFLVIDEAQERKESDWEQTILTTLIDKRYDALKPTVIIANLKPDAIDACLGASIISRCERTGGGIIEANWPPYSS